MDCEFSVRSDGFSQLEKEMNMSMVVYQLMAVLSLQTKSYHEWYEFADLHVYVSVVCFVCTVPHLVGWCVWQADKWVWCNCTTLWHLQPVPHCM